MLKNKQQRIDEEVQKTLQSLDSFDDIEASPYFFSRLQQEIRGRETERFNWVHRLTLGYRLVPIGLIVFVVLNAVSLALTFTSKNSSADYRSVQLQEAAREFTLLNRDFESYTEGD